MTADETAVPACQVPAGGDDELSETQALQAEEMASPDISEGSGPSEEPGTEKTAGNRRRGYLAAKYESIRDLCADDCESPIQIRVPDGTMKILDYCDTYEDASGKYLICRQEDDNLEYMFFIVSEKKGYRRLVGSNQILRKIYHDLRRRLPPLQAVR